MNERISAEELFEQQRERLQEVNEQKCQHGREQRTGKALLQQITDNC